MKGEFFIEIPYAYRSRYIEPILMINELVNAAGMIFLAVNNNPYVLESYLVVETNVNVKEIASIIAKYNMNNYQDKGVKEIVMEMGSNAWDTIDIPRNTTEEQLRMYMQVFYRYREKNELEDIGYFKEFHKKKCFISYSHKDENVVMDVYKQMQLAGINCWIDLYDINVGQLVAKRMLDGIKECDCGIFFLSKNYLGSLMAQAELQNFLTSIFKEQKKWYLIRLDDVDVDEIQYGLSNYKYYEFNKNNDIEKLVEDIKRIVDSM